MMKKRPEGRANHWLVEIDGEEHLVVTRQGQTVEKALDDVLVDVREPEYLGKRRNAYPSVEDQLDMIYWDKVNGTATWVEAVGAVKAAFPKAAR